MVADGLRIPGGKFFHPDPVGARSMRTDGSAQFSEAMRQEAHSATRYMRGTKKYFRALCDAPTLGPFTATGGCAMEHVTPREAEDFLRRNPNALFIDCRSEMEYLFVGHPAGALHVAWNEAPDWEVNPHFIGEVKKLAGHAQDRPVVLICRSGNRSVDAGEALEASGFTRIHNVVHGFEGELDDCHRRGTLNGWRFEGLPWEQC
jgi:rhodanese-related sulfurtransferase